MIDRLDTASAQGFCATRDEVLTLREEGRTKEEIEAALIDLFDRYQGTDEDRSDMIADVLDCLIGHVAKRWRIP